MARTQKSEGPSIREAMEAAINETPEVEEAPVETVENDDEPEVAQESVSSEPEKEAAQPEKEERPQAELTAEHAKAQPVNDYKPPIDWDVNLKQKWKDVPSEVRAAIHQREVHVNQLMQNTANERKFANEVVRTLEPYRAVMAAEGVQNPLQAIDGLMRITATLQMGSPAQKAQAISNLVKHYGIDVEALDAALVGQLPPPDPQQTRLEQMLQERMAPVNQLLERVNQAETFQQQQLYGAAYQSVEEMAHNPKYEFLEDVRLQMSDLMDMAARDGRNMTLDQAYGIACSYHPQISEIMAQRNPAKIAAAKRNAATSLAPSGAPKGGAGSGLGIRELVSAGLGGDTERI